MDTTRVSTKIDPITQAYLDGLYAAALIAQDRAGDKTSHISAAIMAFRMKHELKMAEK